MNNEAYKLGFLNKLAAESGQSGQLDYNTAIQKYFAEQKKSRKLPTRKVYNKPKTLRESISQQTEKNKDYLKSFGKGVTSAAGVTGLRAVQSLSDLVTFFPALADSLLFGRLIGVDEGRGLFGRALGKYNRYLDSKVHALRKWSDDYDYRLGLDQGFGKINRFMNGVAADTAGGFLGGFYGAGSIKNKIAKKILPPLFGTAGAASNMFGGRAKELRDREAWIRTLRPADRALVDATSIATNQEQAPTLNEYRRYHTPSPVNMPASSLGYVKVPYKWWHTSNHRPVQFREFGQ